MGEAHADTKEALRRRVRAARRTLARDEALRLGSAVCARVLALPAYATARRVAAYAAVENEVDPTPVVERAAAAGKAVYYPRRALDGLEFLACSPVDLRPGAAGIPEPVAGDRLDPGDDAVLFLVPGVAFDLRCARLGRGGGHYDRALAYHHGATPIGLAYEMQLVPTVPEAPWDVRMAAVVTETRVLFPKET